MDTEQEKTIKIKVEQKKIRVLALCDSPTAATGFAQVSKNILRGLVATGKYEIDVIGINYFGDYYDRNAHPYNIYPAMPQGYADMYGRGRVLNALNGVEEKSGLMRGWDIVFTIQDPFVIEGLGIDFPFAEQLKVTSELWRRSVPPEFWFKWIGYFPVDAELKENWVTRSMALADYPIAYCEWGRERALKFDKEQFETTFSLAMNREGGKKKARLFSKSLKERMLVIPHGVDTDAFKPLSPEEKKKFRKEFFADAIAEDTYLVVNVSRNQPRKDITRTLAAFAKFKKAVPNSHLYLHCKVQDAGGSIHEMARNFDLYPGTDYTVPTDFNAGIGYSIDIVNKIYNAADLCMTTTLGEGWGFITTEAMATKTPIVAPYITSIIDIFGGKVGDNIVENFRGIPVRAGSTSSEWICMGAEDNERIRPLTNVDDLVTQMIWAYNNPQDVAKIVERAYTWVLDLKWQNIVKQWDELFMVAYKKLDEERVLGRLIDKAGRNDPCPCGTGQKYKHCHGSADSMARYKDWFDDTTDDAVKTQA